MISRLAKVGGLIGVAGVGLYTFNSIPTAYAASGEPEMVFSRFGFTSLRVRAVHTVNQNTKRLVFEFPNPEARSGLPLTSALLTFMRPEGRWFPVLRPYTPISDLDEPGQLELMVKRYPNGAGSSYIHTLKPGDSLTFVAPLRGFPWKPNQFRQIYLLAGGAGITPVYQLIRGILKNPDDRTKITLLFGVNTEDDRLLKDELDEYAKRYPDRFNYRYTISHPKNEGTGDRKGYIDEELLRSVVKGDTAGTKVFVCGPPAMENALVGSRMSSGILGRLGFSKDQVYRF